MATLVVHTQGAAPSFVPLIKPLTTLAAAADSDVRVPDLRGVVAIQFDGESFIATALEGAHLVVNGKRRGQHTLADGDTMELGGTQTEFNAQITERRPGEMLAWQAIDGPRLAEKVTFQQLSDSNTRIIAELDIDARQLMPFEAAEPDSLNRRLKADLTGLKQYVEYGATMSGGQSILGTGTSRGYLPDDAFNDEY